MPVGAYAVASDTGRRRRRNEDNYVVAPPLFAVADGMGGAQAGEVASQLAASALEGGDSGALEGTKGIDELIQEANRLIYDRASTDPSASGMGTTMTVALVEGMTVAIGHVGDSRAYVLREGELEQLTDDHSLVAELVRRGELSPEEAQVHPQRSVITRALGTDPDVDVDTFTLQARDGDVFLLCSDGLTTMVDVETITSLVERDRNDLHAAARALIKEANDRGGDDNITAVLFEVRDGEPDDETVEAVAVPDPEEEDTLHPGEAPVPQLQLADGDTSIVSLDELRRALARDGGAAGEGEAEGEGEGEARASFGRLLLASLVIVVLAALIVFLVLRGLAR